MGRAPDGRVVFVPFTAPGDRVRVRIVEARARFSRAVVEELLEPGGSRIDPVCAVFGSCGGCSWQHVRYSAQLAAKSRILSDALERIGGLGLRSPPEIVPSPDSYAYRSRTRVLVARGRVGYRRRRSHALCPVSRCPVLVPRLEESLRSLAASPPTGAAADTEWELLAGDVVRAVPLSGHHVPDSGHPAGPSGADEAGSAARVELSVGGERIGVSPGVFSQSNALLHDGLARAVVAAAGSGRECLELYAGAGFLTLGLARRFERVVAVESNAAACRDLAHNTEAAGLANVSARNESVEDFLRQRPPLDPPAAIVLDPPRTGLAEGAAEALLEIGAPRIVYLSCDPATLARDLAALVRGPLDLARVEGFDLFPQTPHVEALAVLEREAD